VGPQHAKAGRLRRCLSGPDVLTGWLRPTGGCIGCRWLAIAAGARHTFLWPHARPEGVDRSSATSYVGRARIERPRGPRRLGRCSGANAAGTATVPAPLPRKGAMNSGGDAWRRQRADRRRCARRTYLCGRDDGAARAMDAADGRILWQVSSHAAVLYPPAYWNGRVVFGSCDGVLHCVDGHPTGACWVRGAPILAPEKTIRQHAWIGSCRPGLWAVGLS